MINNKEAEKEALAHGEVDVIAYKKAKRKRGLYLAVGILLMFVFALFCVGQIGHLRSEETLRFWRPNYDKTDVSALLEKEILTEDEYTLLYRQTGLTKLGIDDMRRDADGRAKILKIQDCLFQDYNLITRRFGTFTYTEELGTKTEDQFSVVADVRDGDILVSSSMYVSWWRLGHSALVVDGERNQILEAIKPGHKSEVSHIDVFTYRANFILLRPSVEEHLKISVVEYAKKYLVGVNYSLYTGIFSKKFTQIPQKSNCGHIVWQAYKNFGIDIDSNGGKIVLPKDIYNSKYMQVVQVFGLDLDKLWE
jgi:hypothetical protein